MLADRPLLATKLAVPASMLLLGAFTGCGASSASSFAVLEQPAGSEHQLPPLEDGVLESLGIDPASARHAGDDLDVALFVMRAEGRVCLLGHPAPVEPLIGCAERGRRDRARRSRVRPAARRRATARRQRRDLGQRLPALTVGLLAGATRPTSAAAAAPVARSRTAPTAASAEAHAATAGRPPPSIAWFVRCSRTANAAPWASWSVAQ